MRVFHSYFNPGFEQSVPATVVAYVDAESGVPDCLETAVWAIAAAHSTEVLPRGHYHIPEIGYFWIEGRHPRLERNAQERQGGALHGAAAMIAHYRTVRPVRARVG